jgi:hypothetical protein
MLGIGRRQQCYCAFCKTPRALTTKRRVSFMNLLGAALGAGVVMFAIWQQFDPRVLIIFVAMLAVAETFLQIRWRLNVICRECGFDPVLYLRDASKAADKVKIHLDRREQDSSSLFRAPLRIPKISRQKKDEILRTQQAGVTDAKSGRKRASGSLLSKSI